MANDRQQRAARAEQMRKEREKSDKRQRNVVTVGIVVVVVALIAAAAFAINQVSNQNEKDRALNTPKNVTDDYGIVYSAADAGGEAPAADAPEPVSVELYEDFQCPACQQFEAANGEFLKQQVESGAISITYRPFSFLDENGASPNEYSHRSTNAALCALDTGGVQDYVKVHDYLYQNQPEEGTAGPENPELVTALEGLGITGVDSCVRTGKFIRWIDDAKDAGTDRGVSSTPSVFIGGEAVQDTSQAGLQAAITAAAK